ncbi:unnamed protein product [Cylindrotheca closterium]|uniref:Uncharacterized protein n=1 Tax=Cylindrotheca closterium TaxID=2856 RepID=A0AAD2FJU1_9STRA|nr:unnamed protein product [Cylindrotheca closterium]
MMESLTSKSPNTTQQHKSCQKCEQSLPRHLFSKKEFSNDTSTCHQCRRNQTAERCKQAAKPQIKLGRKADSGIMRRPNNFGYCDYLDQVFSLKCFSDLVTLGVFQSAKDISESMAAIQAAIKHGLPVSPSQNEKKKKIKCLCIGDGSTPRTAVLACYWKQWSCVSIDPALHEEWTGETPKGVRNLIGFGGTLEEFMSLPPGEDDSSYDHLVLLCVHSHARLMGPCSIQNIRNRYPSIPHTTLVSLPCCPKFRSHRDVGRPPDIFYDDDCVFPACRKVEIWNFSNVAAAESPMVCREIAA